MAKAFLICNVEKFMEEDSYQVPIQESLLKHEGEPLINISIKHRNFFDQIDLYNCHHDYKHKKHGKAFNQEFTYFFEPKDFYLFYDSQESLAVVSAKTDISIDYVKILSEYAPFKMEPIKVDFEKIAPLINEMSGVWVSGLKRMHLKTAGFFGPYVNKSNEFIEAAKEGDVSSIQMQYVSPRTDAEHTIGISQKGSIILYDSFKSIEDEIEMVQSIYFNIIKNPLLSGR